MLGAQAKMRCPLCARLPSVDLRLRPAPQEAPAIAEAIINRKLKNYRNNFNNLIPLMAELKGLCAGRSARSNRCKSDAMKE